MESNFCNMPISRRGVLTLLFVLSLVGVACQAENTPTHAPSAVPPNLIGTWQVTEVHTDRGDTRPSDYKYNVHKFLGRVFVFTPRLLTTNAPEDKRCDDLKIVAHHTTTGKVVGTSIASRPFDPNRPTPKDFQLPLSESAPVDVLSLLCKDGLFAKFLGGGLDPGVGIQGAWLIVLNKEQLALRWNDETILILSHLADNTKPVASFDCAKAATDLEKTICGSVALAAYDQSVAQTYKFAMEYYKTKKTATVQLDELKKSQKQWLTRRNACNTDKTCLEKSMGDRIEKIDHEIALYGYDNQ